MSATYRPFQEFGHVIFLSFNAFAEIECRNVTFLLNTETVLTYTYTARHIKLYLLINKVEFDFISQKIFFVTAMELEIRLSCLP